MPTATQDKLTGTVKWYDPNRGYGFITNDATYSDIFAHISQVSRDCDEPRKGDRVTFIEDIGKDGRPYARRIVIVKETESAWCDGFCKWRPRVPNIQTQEE